VIIGSVGVAGIGLGAGFGFAALSTLNEAERECAAPYTHCSAQSIGTRGTAVTFGDVSTAGFVAGAALLAGGLTLYLTAPAEPTRVGFQWAPGRVGVTGEF
jgi:hypothetical protein